MSVWFAVAFSQPRETPFFSRAGELGCTMFGYIPDAFRNNLPALPSESARAAALKQQEILDAGRSNTSTSNEASSVGGASTSSRGSSPCRPE